jgi:hypothetical protein
MTGMRRNLCPDIASSAFCRSSSARQVTTSRVISSSAFVDLGSRTSATIFKARSRSVTMPTNFVVCSLSIMGMRTDILALHNSATFDTASLGKQQTRFFVITSLHFFMKFSWGVVN